MASSNGRFHLDSPAFHNGDLIPTIHAADSLNLSPPLRWTGAPTGTSSFSLIVDDPDVPAGPWVHWVLFNIPADQRSLTAAQPQSLQLSNGARHGSCWGINRYQRIGYQGPFPPNGELHRYVFQLAALDSHLPLPAGSTVSALRTAMQPHVLAEASLTGLYGRNN
ncbi:YbhB/YbcL family Raf kinase inhibitor-like protein [Synechococcus sp. BS55D]|uniref:YbhB/YbcL family Raf kinase inhibitor-like protein n=1 Tax=Synechococcus sp. BS55D TaxID=2055943 RepID=UPI00103E7723|nr:YbhB/YbcL family Raf kinase inhibitor-like protein [Synechococcus sp. BS55D]TCD57023.1 YbhB/YbcL family Raf kinase inhibitor-like protein [Synechococcus sp. BS55D]